MNEAKRNDLLDRIAKGEAALVDLQPSDPRYSSLIERLNGLREQIGRPLDPLPPAPLYKPPPVDQDPRPDLTDDSGRWDKLLKLAISRSLELCGVLNGIRCGGTRIKIGKTAAGAYRWILMPDVDPSGRLAWSELAEYEEMRDTYLKPFIADVTTLLQELSKFFLLPGSEVQEQMKI